jgi:BirA family biotin operon repressor/biotin-[acetyl-CoA-carboxylase] ligase
MSSQQPSPTLLLALVNRLKNLQVSRFAEVGSTSDLALDAARAGAAEGATFRADIQTSGRGRHGRDWVSPKGNLYLSVLLRPSRPKPEWPGLSLVAGLALHDALAGFRGAERVRLKWPNDVLFDDRKVAGLLLEVHDDAVILGCGVNCAHVPEIPTGWAPGWLNQNGDEPRIDADAVMESLAVRLCQRYNDWQEDGTAALAAHWMDVAAHRGMLIEVHQSDGQTVCGIFETLDADGGMMLRLADGELKKMMAGDVLRVRPEGNG